MPSTRLPRHKGLQTSSQLLLFCGRSLLLGSTTWLSLSQPFSALAGGGNAHLFPRSSAKSAGEDRVIGRLESVATAGSIFLTLSLIPSATGPSCQSRSCHIYHPAREYVCASSLGNIMSGCSYLPGQAGLVARDQVTPKRSSGPVLTFATRADIGYSYKGLDYCRRASASLRNREPCGRNMVYRCFWSDAMVRSWKSNPLIDPLDKHFHLWCTAPYSAGAAADVSFDGTPRDEQLENSAISSEQKLLGERTLKLVSGSCYLPHPAKEDTGGEDAHFICVQEQAIGVADGVGGWADLGVDAGQYARELMSNSVTAIQDEPKGSIDPARVLETAYSNTKARGSSTACIIALTDQGIHAVNLGDSGFIVVRDGCTIFRSPVQQHDFNFTYQLESGNGSDLPSAAQVFNFSVACGDVIITGTDGLFDNLYNNEVTAVVVHAMRAGLGPQVTAQKIAALARQRAQDRNRQTPFSTAAQDAGYRYYGGKLDDITVVVSYITAFSV